MNTLSSYFTRHAYPRTSVSCESIPTDMIQYCESRFGDMIDDAMYGTYAKSERYARIEQVFLHISNHLQSIKIQLRNVCDDANPSQSMTQFREICNSYSMTCACARTLLSYGMPLESTFRSALLASRTKHGLVHQKKRVDLRHTHEVRPLYSEIDYLPTTHGSSLFQRGETQVINVLTLGSPQEHMQTDTMEDFTKTFHRFFHHYNFPPYSVGETGKVGFTSRREIGHGNLAQKAVEPILPSESHFPYTIRLVSECMGSNGSTSMASTCASVLTLMDGGVPIRDIVAGVAMGLAIDTETSEYTIVSDIQGWEDHYASMDFKVTGSRAGITAIQLDNKAGGLSCEIIFDALSYAHTAREHIISHMEHCIPSPRPTIKDHAPRMKVLYVPMDKMRDVIGSGGAIINGLEIDFGVTVDLENETGKCVVFGSNMVQVEACFHKIQELIRVYQVGDTITGTIFRIEPYGAFIRFDHSQKESMIHISKLGNGKRIEQVEDIVRIGDRVKVKIAQINQKGQFELELIEHIQ